MSRASEEEGLGADITTSNLRTIISGSEDISSESRHPECGSNVENNEEQKEINTEKSSLEPETLTTTRQYSPQTQTPSGTTSTIISPQDQKQTAFPLLSLPTELRHKIYGYYIASLPPYNPVNLLSSLALTQKSQNPTLPTSPLTQPQINPLTPLHQTSHALSNDIPLYILYQNLTFLLTTPQTILSLSTVLPPIHLSRIRDVKISLGVEGVKGRDWVFLVLSTFPQLSSLEFEFQDESSENESGDESEREGDDYGNGTENRTGHRRGEMHMWDEGWWNCVRDAVREGVCCTCNAHEGQARGRGRKRGMLLSVRCGDVVGRERVGGAGK